MRSTLARSASRAHARAEVAAACRACGDRVGAMRSTLRMIAFASAMLMALPTAAAKDCSNIKPENRTLDCGVAPAPSDADAKPDITYFCSAWHIAINIYRDAKKMTVARVYVAPDTERAGRLTLAIKKNEEIEFSITSTPGYATDPSGYAAQSDDGNIILQLSHHPVFGWTIDRSAYGKEMKTHCDVSELAP